MSAVVQVEGTACGGAPSCTRGGVCVCGGEGAGGTCLVAVVHGRGDLPEDAPGLLLRQPPPLLDVVVQLPPSGQLHHHHDPLAALKHCTGTHKHTV